MNTHNTFNELKPVVRIGKNGLGETVIEEIKKHIKKKKTIKIKLLRAYVKDTDKNIIFMELAKKLDAEILEKKGFTVVLHKNIK